MNWKLWSNSWEQTQVDRNSTRTTFYPFAIETTTEEDCNKEDDGEDQLKMSLEKLTRPFAKASLMLCVKSIAEDTLAGNANSAVDWSMITTTSAVLTVGGPSEVVFQGFPRYSLFLWQIIGKIAIGKYFQKMCVKIVH